MTKTTNQKTISDFDQEISVDLPLSLKLPSELLSEEDYSLVAEMFKICDKYKSGDWYTEVPVTEMQSDCVRLQSLLVSCTHRHGVLIAYADTIEDQMKLARSKVRVAAKNLKNKFRSEGFSVNMTLDDHKDLSYTKTEDIWAKLQNASLAANFVKFAYFAVKDQVMILDRAIHRIHRFEQ